MFEQSKRHAIQWYAIDGCTGGGEEPATPYKLDTELREANGNLEGLEKEYIRLRHVDTHPTIMAGLHGPSGYFSFAVPKALVIAAMEKDIAALKARIAKLAKAQKTVRGIASRALA